MTPKTSVGPKIAKLQHRKRCLNCGKIMHSVWFTTYMTGKWFWNGNGYEECSTKEEAIFEAELSVICPYCSTTVGTGYDFGFGREKITIKGKL